MDLQLLNELHERNIAGTYMESKFFLNPGNAKVINRKDLAEINVDELVKIFNGATYVFHFAAYAAECLSPFIRTYNYKNNL